VLKGFSFEVKPGQKVACVGRAGCGKSTSVGLLQRLYTIDAGSISIDGEAIERSEPPRAVWSLCCRLLCFIWIIPDGTERPVRE
jgi:ABC-type transport system involved in cytochrome bd biosynthesis fused ATPase/permease subunit